MSARRFPAAVVWVRKPRPGHPAKARLIAANIAKLPES